MRYRLGQFPLQEGLFSAGLWLEEDLIRRLEEYLEDARPSPFELDADSYGALKQMLAETRARADAKKNMPDLLEALGRGDADRPWVREVHATMTRTVRRRESLRLVACERDGGALSIAAFDRSKHFTARTGDVVSAGFAVVRDDEGLAVYPRFVRQTCVNGTVILLAAHANILEETGSVAEAITRCVSGGFLAKARELVQAAAARPMAADASAFLDEPELWTSRERILANYRRGNDRTAWGLWNAVSSHARAMPNFRRRLRMELDGAWLLQRLAEAGAVAPRTV